MWHLIKAGRVAGLGGSPAKAGNPRVKASTGAPVTEKERKRLEKKRQAFKDDLMMSIAVRNEETFQAEQDALLLQQQDDDYFGDYEEGVGDDEATKPPKRHRG